MLDTSKTYVNRAAKLRQPGERVGITESKDALLALDGCIVDHRGNDAVRVDCYVEGLMDLQVVIGTLADKSEVVDKCEFGGSACERERIHFLGHANGVVSITGSEPGATCTLRLEVGFYGRPVVVDSDVLLDMESALNQHEFSGSTIGARDEIYLGKRDEIVSGDGEGLGKRWSCQTERHERNCECQAESLSPKEEFFHEWFSPGDGKLGKTTPHRSRVIDSTGVKGPVGLRLRDRRIV